MSAPLEQLLRDARIDLVLGRIEKDPSVINEVIRHLDSQIRSIKFNSIHVLGELGERSINAIDKLVSCLDDEDWSICREAARSLGKIGNIAEKAMPKLSTLLEDKEESIRKEVAIALGKIGNPTKEAITRLINALKDKSDVVRTEVAKALGEIGPGADEAIPDLMNGLKDTSWTVRTSSAQSISQIGRESKKAIPSLINSLQDRDWRVRYRVINTLAEIGEPAVPYLLEIIDHPNKIVRKGVIDALGEIKLSNPKIIEKLGNTLNDTEESVRGKGADALRSIGKDSIPVLIKSYHKPVKYRFSDFTIPLILINLPYFAFLLTFYCASILPGFFETTDLILMIEFVSYFIGHVGWIVGLIIICYEIYNFIRGNFFRVFKDFNKGYKHKILIISAIGGIGEFAQEHISFVIEQLKFRKKFVRVEAARALGQMGVNSEDAVYALEKALNDPKSIVRRGAALSLGKLGSSSTIVIPSLVKALKDGNPDVRWRASEALGIIGVNTEEVISSLNLLIHDECDYVCESAIDALDTLTEE